MQSLDTLIRLHNHELDQKRLQLKQLEEQAAGFENEIATMKQRLEQEKIESGKDVTALPTLENYKKWNETQREQLGKLLKRKRDEIEKKMEEIFAAFQELKKFEITDERLKEEEAHEEKLREQGILDEIALQKDHRAKKQD